MPEIKAKVVLMDIEGTTSSISFVKEVLFPYAKQNAECYLKKNWDEPTTQVLVQDLQRLPQFQEYAASFSDQSAADSNAQQTAEKMTKFINYLIDKDLKLGPLKTLQGYIWAEGYANGSIKGHVYCDVPDAIKRWQKAGLWVAIYSSGSIKAQRLLFRQTEYGNLLPHIAAHFDTTTGPKLDAASYTSIARDLGVSCSEVLFLTDIVQEAQAAQTAGMQTIILNRPGNAPLTAEQLQAFVVVDNFDALQLQRSETVSN